MAVSNTIPLSQPARNAADHFGGGENIMAWSLVKENLRVDHDIGGELGGKLSRESGPQKGNSQPADKWLRDLNELFDSQEVQELDGRLVILGLSRLDSELHDYLSSYGFIDALEDELSKPFESLLRDQSESMRVKTSSVRGVVQSTPEVVRLEGTDRVSDTVQQALARANALAQATTGQVDSIMLLAALLIAGLSREKPKAVGPLLSAMHQQIGFTPPSLPDEHIFQLLELSEHYGIQSLPSEAESGSPQASYTPEVERVLSGAVRLANQVSDGNYVSNRRLLAALLAPGWVTPAPEAQGYLRSLEFDLGELRRTLWDYIRENYLGENLDVWKQVLLPYIPPAAGYISDSVLYDVPDRLNIEHEVATIAYVLTSKLVKPPLSLGLFGDWGSGKSFFMVKLRNYINNIAKHYRDEERQTGLPARWCSRVVQIEFNAWHYSDANLWASLVTRIYEALFNELREKTDEDDRARLEDEIRQAEGVVREAEAQLNGAKSQVTSAENTLSEAQQKRENEEENLQNLIGDVSRLLSENPAIRDDLEKAAEALGYPEAVRSFQALQELDEELSSFTSRSLALGLNLIRSPWALLLLVVLIIVVPVGASLLVNSLQEWLGPVAQRIIEASTFLAGLFAWLHTQIGKGMSLVDDVDNAYREAQRVRQVRLKAESGEVKEAKDALARARSEEQAAQNNLQNAQQELLRVQRELVDLRPERKLYRLIEERGRSATYSQHLGIISLIRADFEKMSELLNDLLTQKRDLKDRSRSAPIQRIILYIDDLDRCSPERVVEVLEAVHLLLAFPLFVVVVGVDPRWLRHSLEQRYPYTLQSNSEAQVSIDGRLGLSVYSTPQDYLEKIFQIPFALRPVEREGYQSLVEDLLKPLPPAEGISTVSLAEDDGGEPEERSSPVSPPTEPTEPRAEEPRPNRRPEGADREREHAQVTGRALIDFSPLNPAQLEFTSWEEADIDRLWPLFRTPRTVKRYINTYRLLRAGLRTEQEEAAFAGTESEPGEYQVALLLLAVVTAFPNQSELFLYLLNNWIEQPSPQAFDAPAWHWDEIIDLLGRSDVSGAANEETRETGQRDDSAKGADTKEDSPRPQEPLDPAFEELIDALEMISAEGFQRVFSKAELQRWALRVARYSFSIQPL